MLKVHNNKLNKRSLCYKTYVESPKRQDNIIHKKEPKQMDEIKVPKNLKKQTKWIFDLVRQPRQRYNKGGRNKHSAEIQHAQYNCTCIFNDWDSLHKYIQ